MTASLAAERPAPVRPEHVPAERVVHFDIYDVPGADEDVQLAYRAFQQSCPDIFWTPANGGHWVATRAEDIEAIQRDPERFSHRRVTLPPMPPEMPPQIPLELDPPVHAAYRRPLTRALLPKVVNALEAKVNDTAVSLIEGLKPRGECDFVADFAKILPIVVFLDLVDLPRADSPGLLELTEDAVRGTTMEVKQRAHAGVAAYLHPWVTARRERPGDDLLSVIVNADIDGERIGFGEAMAFASLVLFGGLDTVASVLGFIAHFLARNPDHRRQLCDRLDDDAFLNGAIEELLRRHGAANTARVVTRDLEFKGVFLKAGDMILPPNLLYGLDERRVDDPLRVDFTRPFPVPHAVFGNGAHTCPGAVLARREIKAFLREWLRRIPDFQVKPGAKPVLATGMVNGVLSLPLVW
ncbi:cytochrome P450 [Nitrospirillum viridazoti]|uniref:Cytochrome n=1 Tax=Nitrospirillum viridazoti CBAmc TaxID=1441467 RepID=A0A248JVP9_9PROT|nr:cytochrome P450 [Nitrospirillum amazonense]ASG22198.1 cytochrome [Nitrospirillum amazonense CBAmc]TWB31040.1 cytochrome P450 [Nitrospirillum amazonense]